MTYVSHPKWVFVIIIRFSSPLSQIPNLPLRTILIECVLCIDVHTVWAFVILYFWCFSNSHLVIVNLCQSLLFLVNTILYIRNPRGILIPAIVHPSTSCHGGMS